MTDDELTTGLHPDKRVVKSEFITDDERYVLHTPIVGTCSICGGPVIRTTKGTYCEYCGAVPADRYGPLIQMVKASSTRQDFQPGVGWTYTNDTNDTKELSDEPCD